MNSELPTPNAKELASRESLTQTIDRLSNLIDGRDDKRADSDPIAFYENAKTRTVEFNTYFETPRHKMTSEKRKEFNDWIENDEAPDGQHQLEKLADAFSSLWGSIETRGLPGHDKRHLQEDLKAGLQFRTEVVAGKGKDEYQKVALLGSWMHDIGRLVEERVHGTPTGGEMGKDHAMMSFAVTKDILDHFSGIPLELRDHIAYSVLNHQTWPNKERQEKDPVAYSLIMDEPMPRSVMGADRMQLIGPEAILRFWGFDAGESDSNTIITPLNPEMKNSLKDYKGLLHHTEFYMRNLLPVDVPGSPENANKSVIDRANRFKAISGIYLWLSATDEIRDQIFAPELGKSTSTPDELANNRKRPLSVEVWSQINAVKENGLPTDIANKVSSKLVNRTVDELSRLDNETSTHLLRILTRELVSAPNASVTEKELNNLYRKIDDIPQGIARARTAHGLSYAITMREIVDKEHEEVIKGILKNQTDYPTHSIEHKLARFVSDQPRAN